MKTWLIILGLAATAGLACGALWPRGGIGAEEGRSTAAKADAMKPNVLAALIGASGATDEALGAALSELLSPRGGLRGLAVLGAALEHLDARGIAKLLEQIERGDSRLQDDRLAWLFAWWMKRDPAAASGWLRPRLDALAQDGPLGFSFENSGRARLLVAWTQADPRAALECARTHAHTGVAKALLGNVCMVWPKRDDPALLALLLDFPAGEARDTALDQFHRSWAGRDPAAAFASAQALPPGDGRDKAIPTVLLAWAEKDAAAAFKQYRALGLSDPALLSKVLSENAAKNPAETLGWLQQLDPAQVSRCAPKIVAVWAEHDPAAALVWALANGVRLAPHSESSFSSSHDGFGRSSTSWGTTVNPLGQALARQPEATLAWLRSLPAGPERDRTTELAVSVCRDRDQALALFSTLAPDAAARVASNVAVQFREEPERGYAWASALPEGPARAAAWKGLASLPGELPNLPPGPDRDALLSGTLNRSGITPAPADQLAMMLEIRDPVLRRDMFDEVLERYRNYPRYADQTRAALEQAAVPEEWKRRWRETLGNTP